MKKIAFLSLLILALISTPALAADITFEGSAIGAGTSQRAGGFHIVHFEIEPIGVAGPVSAAKIMMQGSPSNDGDVSGAITNPVLSAGDTSEQFANGLFYYFISDRAILFPEGINYSKAATGTNTFTRAHVISASKYGAIRIFINVAGTISTDVPLATQAYDTALAAITAANLVTISISKIQIGMIVIQNNGSLWTANTDDLINASDITLVAFYNITSSFTEIDEHELSADEITAQKGTFYVSEDLPANWIRIFLSEMTGEGNFVITGTLR